MTSSRQLLLLLAIAISAPSPGHAKSIWSSIRGGSTIIKPRDENTYAYSEFTVADGSLNRKQRSSSKDITVTKLSGIIQGFQRAVPASRSSEGDLHVGKLLFAFQQMKGFMQDTGMSQVAKTIDHNIAKVEAVYRNAPAQTRDSLAALLRYEIASGVQHGKNGELKDSSAAMGMAWLGRTLSYQQSMYHLILEENQVPLDAAYTAFQEHLKPHLHWTVGNVLQAAIRSLTPSTRESLFSKVGGFEEAYYGDNEDVATVRDLRQMTSLWQPLLDELEGVFADAGLNTTA